MARMRQQQALFKDEESEDDSIEVHLSLHQALLQG